MNEKVKNPSNHQVRSNSILAGKFIRPQVSNNIHRANERNDTMYVWCTHKGALPSGLPAVRLL